MGYPWNKAGSRGGFKNGSAASAKQPSGLGGGGSEGAVTGIVTGSPHGSPHGSSEHREVMARLSHVDQKVTGLDGQVQMLSRQMARLCERISLAFASRFTAVFFRDMTSHLMNQRGCVN